MDVVDALIPEKQAPAAEDLSATGVRWDLTPLMASAAEARERFQALSAAAADFAARWRGRVGVSAAALAMALKELAALKATAQELSQYVFMRESTASGDEEVRDLKVLADRADVEFENTVRFFELEWMALPESEAMALLADEALAGDRNWLSYLRRLAPHRLSEAEERVLEERSPSAEGAWQSLHEETLSYLAIPFDDGGGEEPLPLDSLLAYLYRPERELRHRAAAALFSAIEPVSSVLARCYDSLVADRLTVDRLRGYREPIELTNLENDVSGAVVEALLETVTKTPALPQRWYREKARLLGSERLEWADQHAPLGSSRRYGFSEAKDLVLRSFGDLSPQAEAIARAFFDERRIDAEPRLGKRGGAYCDPLSRRVRPYVLMNFTGDAREVSTLAHELGHGLHFELALAAQTQHSAEAGTAVSEIASIFAELVLAERLLEGAEPRERLRVLSRLVEDALATVYRQVMMTRFETRAYAARRGGQALTAERLSQIWLEENERYMGEALALPEGYRLGWAYVPHFVDYRLYTYAYAFAHLVALALLGRLRQEGEAFAEHYLDFLAAGGSRSPQELLLELGVDIESAAFWREGLDELSRLVEAAVDAAADVDD